MTHVSSDSLPPVPSRGYLWLMILVNFWGMGLGMLPAPLTGALVEDLGLKGGDITVSWFIAIFLGLNAIFTPVWVYIGEHTSRHKALVAAVLGWTCCALAIRFARDGVTFGVLWGLAGIADAALVPLTYSLTVDLVPPARRGQTFGLLSTMTVLSGGCVIMLGGFLVDRYGWQVPFLVVGLQGLALTVLLVAMTRYEPHRGAMEAGLQSLFAGGRRYEQRLHLRDFSSLLHPRANLWLVLASLLSTIPVNVVASWFIRMLQKDHDFSTARATLLTLFIFTAQVPGSMLLGRLGDRAQTLRLDGRARVITLALLATLPFYLVGFLIPFGGDSTLSAGLLVFTVLMLAGAFITSAFSPLMYSHIGEINRPEARGVVFALINITRVVARGGGGLLLTYSAARWFEGRLSPALALLSVCLVPAAVLMVPVMRSAGKDREGVEEHLRRYVESHTGDGGRRD